MDGDLIDVDGDTYPGISEEDYGMPFPARFAGRPVDCADDPAIVADAASINPGATEIPYDGLDSDCAFDNDFDADDDGYMPTTEVVDGVTVDVASAFAAYVKQWNLEDRVKGWAPPGSQEPQLGDCNDFDLDVHPNPASPDVWYDGDDTDCDGANDFDADGDGFMPPTLPDGSPTQPAYDAFIIAYHDNAPPWTLPSDVVRPDKTVLDAFSDCLDQPDPAIVDPVTKTAADPAMAYPAGAEAEIFYDGIDGNCWADNDFDADADGFYPLTAKGPAGPIKDVGKAYATYIAQWGYEDFEDDWADVNPDAGLAFPEGGDCDDSDGNAWPGALERLSDEGDEDCDGTNDVSPFFFHTYTWEEPSPPRMTRLGDTYVLAVTAANAELAAAADDVGQALFFDASTASSQVFPAFTRAWKASSSSHRIQPVADVFVDPDPEDLDSDGIVDPGMWFVTAYTSVGSANTFLYGTELHWESRNNLLVAGPAIYNSVAADYAVQSLEVALDDDASPYLLACATGVLHAVRGLDFPPTEPELEDLGPGGGTCFLNARPTGSGSTRNARLVRCGGGLPCTEHLIEGTTALALSSVGPTGESWTAGDFHDGYQVLRDANGVVLRDLVGAQDYDLFTGENVLSADAMLYNGNIYAAAVVNSGGGTLVRLLHGPYNNMTTLDFPFASENAPDARAEHVSIFVDDDRIALAVSGYDGTQNTNQDAVGWVFLGH